MPISSTLSMEEQNIFFHLLHAVCVEPLQTITLSESIEETQCQTLMHCECSYKNNDISINAEKFEKRKVVSVEFTREGFLLKLFIR